MFLVCFALAMTQVCAGRLRSQPTNGTALPMALPLLRRKTSDPGVPVSLNNGAMVAQFASEKTVKYLVLMETGSVGSSWLMNMLKSHPKILAEGENIKADSGDGRAEAYLRFLNKGRRSGLEAIGLKVKRDRMRGNAEDANGAKLGAFIDGTKDHDDRVPEVTEALAKSGAKLLCLLRRNYVKHAVSQVRHWQMHKVCDMEKKSWEAHTQDCVEKMAKQPIKSDDFEKIAQTIDDMKMGLADTIRICQEYEGASALLNYEVLVLPEEKRNPLPRPYRTHPAVKCPDMEDLGDYDGHAVPTKQKCQELCNAHASCVSFLWSTSKHKKRCQLSSFCFVSTAWNIDPNVDVNATLNVVESISVLNPGPSKWVSKDKIWDHNVCTNIGEGGGSFESCKRRCGMIPSCTAINLPRGKNVKCDLLACPPDAEPTLPKKGRHAYHVADWKKDVNFVTLRSLDDVQVWLGVTPQILQSTNKKTTPPDLKKYLVNYDELRVWMADKYGEDSEEVVLFERSGY